MVLLSEFTVTSATVVIFTAYLGQVTQETITSASPYLSRNHASVILATTLNLYMATRMLLEGESPQSVIPVFLVVVFVLASILATGKYYRLEWIVRFITILVASISLLTFIFYKGLTFLSERAAKHALDCELQWYHVSFLYFSSWRLLTAICAVSIPVFKRKWGAIAAIIKIVLLWVIFVGSGSSVAPSPWGALDEILLERTSLLFLILGLTTFAIVMDHVAAYVSLLIDTCGEAERVDWDCIKSQFFAELVDARSDFMKSNGTKSTSAVNGNESSKLAPAEFHI